jgi:hypothetical protein
MARFSSLVNNQYGIQILDAHETYEDFIAEHPTGEPGDAHIVGTHLYSWNVESSSWLDAGEIVGPQGETGERGPIGLTGPQGETGDTGPAGGFGASASYHSRVDQGPHTPANTVQAFTFSTTDWETGIQRVDNTKIKMLSAGKYNIAFSAQLHQTNSSGTINIWLNKNGTPMAYTNTKVAITSNNPYYVAAWNFFVDAAANDFYELIWSSSSTNTVVEYDPAQTISGNLHPEIPSIIVTVNQVG